MATELTPLPWYKHGWPIFLIVLTLFGVMSALGMVYLAVTNPASVISQDYYKQGQAINSDIAKYNRSLELKIKAIVSFEEKALNIVLDKGMLEDYPTLNIALKHRTLPYRDQSYIVNTNGKNQYKIALKEPISGPWFIEILPFDQSWKLRRRVNLPIDRPLTIKGTLDY